MLAGLFTSAKWKFPDDIFDESENQFVKLKGNFEEIDKLLDQKLEIIFIGGFDLNDNFFEALEVKVTKFHNTSFVVYSPNTNPELLMKFMHSGVHEVIRDLSREEVVNIIAHVKKSKTNKNPK